jgi:hypothetical protein
VAFDFPASPSQGQIYAPTGGPAYQWDGEKWKGGQPSGPQTEQFFDASGLANVDIQVPTWAKGVEITGNTMSASGTYPVLRVSMDGTTFLAGATDYSNVGPIHNTGSSGYAVAALATGDHIQLGLNSDVPTFPQLFTANMTLVRPTTSTSYHLKNYLSLFQSLAANQYRTYWNTGEVRNATGLAIKALRVLCNGGTFNAGSWVRVKWLGDAAQVPISNAIPDSPHDGGHYVRQNGLWVRATPVLQDVLYYDSTDFSRNAVSEAVMSNPQNIILKSPTSKVFWEAAIYSTITSTASIDDLRARFTAKYFDGAAYVNVGVRGNPIAVFGHVNWASPGSSSVFYNHCRLGPLEVTGCVRSDAPNQIMIRMYGNPDYASSTLDAYDCTMRFTEVAA